jgi:hypothetical protein
MPLRLLMQNGRMMMRAGRILARGVSAACCCGCPFYYRAAPCAASHPCPLFVPDIYVCSTDICAQEPHGTVLVYPSGCWALDKTTTYPTLPPGAVVAGQTGLCWPPGSCNACPPRRGYYQAVPCPCSNTPPGTPVKINAVIDCESEWENRRNGIRCPTYLTAEGGCVQAAIWELPIEPDPSMEILAGATVDGCCRCCIAQCEQLETQGVQITSNGPGQFPTTTTFPIQCCCGHWRARWREERRIYFMVNGNECLVQEDLITADMSSDQPFEQRCYTWRTVTYDCNTGASTVNTSTTCGHNCDAARGPSSLASGLQYDFGSLRIDCTGAHGSGGQNYLPGGQGFRVEWSIQDTIRLTPGPCRGTCESDRPPGVPGGPIGPGPIGPISITPIGAGDFL